MTEKFKILGKFIKDLSVETKNAETYLYVKDNISKYQLDININSKAIKNKMIEVNTILSFQDKDKGKNSLRSYFEMTYTTIVRIDEDVKEKTEMEKIILRDLQNKIAPDLEKSFLDVLHNSGYKGVKFQKKLDFNKLYNEIFN